MSTSLGELGCDPQPAAQESTSRARPINVDCHVHGVGGFLLSICTRSSLEPGRPPP